MEINIVQQVKNWGFRLSHKSESMIWHANQYKQVSFGSSDKWVELLNTYWRDLTEQEQGYIWECYTKIDTALSNDMDVATTRSIVGMLAGNLMDMHPLENITRYLAMMDSVYLPDDLKQEHELELPTDKLYGRELTYTDIDYAHLQVFTAALQVLTPVFAKYYEVAVVEAGKIKPRIYTAMLPIIESTWLVKSEAYIKLVSYMQATMQNSVNGALKEQGATTLAMAGVTEYELELILTSAAIIHRLAIAEYRVDESNLVSLIYNKTGMLLNTLHKRVHEAMVHNKFVSKDSSEEGNTSGVETYQIAQEVSDMVHLSLEVYLEDHLRFARLVYPDIDESLLEQALILQQANKRTRLTEGKLHLLSIVLRKELPYRTLRLVNLATMQKLLAITQVVLYQRGHVLLSIFVGSDTTISNTECTYKNISSPKVAILTEMYPHYKPSERTAKQIPIGKAYDKTITMSLAIDSYTPIAPATIISYAVKNNYIQDGKADISVPIYIREVVADLMIDFLR